MVNQIPIENVQVASSPINQVAPVPKNKSRLLILLIITLFIIAVIVGIAGYIIFIIKGKAIQLQQLHEITVNFLLRPSFQAEPRLFINGIWHHLPNSQTNTYIPEQKKLVACGEGGVYIYDATVNKIIYVYKEKWHPCYAIIKDSKDNVTIADSDGTMILDLNTNKIINSDNSYVMNSGEAMQKAAEDKKNIDFTKVCTTDKKNCAFLSDGEVRLVSDEENEELAIANAIALVGIHDKFLFYAVDDSYGYHKSFIPKANAVVLNHNLFVYDIAKKKNIKLLDSFRYDYEEMIFFDTAVNNEVLTEENLSNVVRQSLMSVPQLKNYTRKKSPNESLNKRLADKSNVDLPTDSDYTLGDKNSPLILIIYCDFESPDCKQVFLKTVSVLAEEFKSRLKIVYRHVITRNQYISQEAAETSECVAKTSGNDGFWKFVEAYYKKTSASGNSMEVAQMPHIASLSGADINKIATCLINGEETDKVVDDIEKAWRQGVGGAGTMIIVRPDGTKQEQAGILNLETLRIVISEQLQKVQQ